MIIGWPEGLLLGLVCIEVGIHVAKHGEARTYNVWIRLADAAILIGLLWWGGFFA